MEAFPHSGTQLASVHPCKHAAVMKKFIDRMEAASEVPAEGGSSTTPPGKKRWLGGVMRKVTGGDKPASAKVEGEEEPSGLQVDFYLVIVSRRLRMGWLTNNSSSSLSLALCPLSRWTAPRPFNAHVNITLYIHRLVTKLVWVVHARGLVRSRQEAFLKGVLVVMLYRAFVGVVRIG